uniref:Uncharacterized protein n=1 Tax=Cacopsylla melanoneura TaxID=428564 RepID=A0A8D9BAF9_9HEMI
MGFVKDTFLSLVKFEQRIRVNICDALIGCYLIDLNQIELSSIPHIDTVRARTQVRVVGPHVQTRAKDTCPRGTRVLAKTRVQPGLCRERSALDAFRTVVEDAVQCELKWLRGVVWAERDVVEVARIKIEMLNMTPGWVEESTSGSVVYVSGNRFVVSSQFEHVVQLVYLLLKLV